MKMKRIADCCIAALLLAIACPLLAAAAAAVWLTLGRPVFFRQTRPGYLEKPFAICKFRTMREVVDQRGEQLPDGQRLGALGRFLRRSSLDELPELWNVLRGEMSLVGPRPFLTRYLPYYTAEERLRFTVRPGITGWAQIHGRNEASWEERLRNDLWYVRHRSAALDCKILLLTVGKVLRGAQVAVDAHASMQNLDEERAHWGAA